MHSIKIDELLNEYGVDKTIGLTDDKVEINKKKYGLNKLEVKKNSSFLRKFINQFKDFMIYILILISLISFSSNENIEGGLILFVVFVNALIGVIQEQRAEKSVEGIKNLSAPHSTVLRNGNYIDVKSEDIVPGDIIVLKSGDIVGADIRLIETNYLRINESHLTGESVPVNKDPSDNLPPYTLLAKRKNMAYLGTIVTAGSGLGIVVSTGKNTEIGKISSLITSVDDSQTPLQKEIHRLGKRLVLIASILIFIIFILNITLHLSIEKDYSLKMFKLAFMTSVALAVAAIPEGLPAIVSVILSLGMKKLANEKAIVKNLLSVETLGSVDIICTDKTGTLTQNVMQVKNIYLEKNDIDLDNPNLNDKKFKNSLLYAILASNSVLNEVDGELKKIGDPMEIAFLEYAKKVGFDYEEEVLKYEKIHLIPFSSETKKMSVIVKIDNKYILITKGAPDFIVPKLRDKDQIKLIFEKNEILAAKTLRSLSIQYKIVDENFTPNDINKVTDYEFLALYSMYDPPKKDVNETIIKAHNAGIRTIVLTGDNLKTAVAIAKECGVIDDDEKAINATELSNLTEDELINVIENKDVYVRVVLRDELGVINVLNKLGYTVSMTGDGVNDGPALKIADIGIAMGKSGTEVAKDASDLILADDNYSTIVKAVKQGRRIYDNIKKAISFALSSNLGEIIGILLITIIMTPILKQTVDPFSATQLLWINLVTDSLLGIALGFDKASDDIMNKPPKNKNDSFLAKKNWYSILISGFIIGSITAASYIIGYYYLPVKELHNNDLILTKKENGQVLAFLTITLLELFHAFNLRNRKKLIVKQKVNFYLIGAFIISLGLQLLIMLVPQLRNIFGLAELNPMGYAIAFGFAISFLLFYEFVKIIKKIDL